MTQIPTENNQESNQTSPRGASAHIERQEAHERLFDGETGFENVVMKLYTAERALEKGYTASSYLSPDYTFITTTTMHDRVLEDWDWEREEQVVRRFKPDIHIPTDYPVYEDHSVAVRQQNIRDLLEGTVRIDKRLSDIKTQILPLLKGVNAGEREIFYQVFNKMDYTTCAFYCTQYFTEGPGISAVKEDLQEIATEAPGLDIFLIGLLSPEYLEDLPPNVVGAAGGRKWRQEVGLRNEDIGLPEMRSRSRRLASRIRNAVSSGQAPLELWMPTSDIEVRN